MSTETTDLIRVAETWCRARGLSEATLSTKILAKGSRLAALREGAGINVKTLNRAMRWLSENWPVNAAWPSDVQRPQIPAPPPGGTMDAPAERQSGSPLPTAGASIHTIEDRAFVDVPKLAKGAPLDAGLVAHVKETAE